MVRSDDSAEQASERLKVTGVEPYAGDLQDPESLKRGVAAADGVIHAGISIPDYTRLDLAFAKERAVVESMLTTLAGTGRPFVYKDTGDKTVDETVAADATGDVGLRAAVEQVVVAAAKPISTFGLSRPGRPAPSSTLAGKTSSPCATLHTPWPAR